MRGFGIRVLLVEPAYTKTDMESNSLEADTPQPLYAETRAKMTAMNAEMMATGDDPSVVAQTILRAAKDASPDLRNPAGKAAKQISLLRRLVPSKLFDKSLRKQMGLPA